MEQSQGLARSSSVEPVAPQIATNTPPQAMPSVVWRGVPLDIYKYLGVDFSEASDKHIEELNDLYKYAVEKSNGRPGDVIQKIEELQVKLGEPRIGETRLMQLTNWIRVRNVIADANKQLRVLEKNVWH